MATIEDRWFVVVDGQREQTTAHGRGLRWRVRYRDPAGDGRSRSFTRKDDAELFRAETETSIASSTYIDPARGRVKVGELAGSWLAVKTATRKRRTASSYAEVYRCLVEPRWARVPVSAVTFSDVQVWISGLVGRGLSPSRVRHAHQVLRSIMRLAANERRVALDPTLGVELPPIRTSSRKRYLLHGQLVALAAAADGYEALVLLLGYGGLRWGEAIALRVRDVDQVRRRVIVSHTIVEDGGRLYEDTPKTHKTRTVPIADPAWRPLLDTLDDKGPDELIFTSPQGGMLRSSNFRRSAFDPAVTAAGIPHVTPHDLRHTAASLAISSGASVLAVQRMLGHARASMTLDVYADLFEQDLDDVAARMSEAAKAAPAWEPPRSIARA